VRTLIKLLQKE